MHFSPDSAVLRPQLRAPDIDATPGGQPRVDVRQRL